MTLPNLDQYLDIQDPIILAELIEKLVEPQFTLKDFKEDRINSRILFHWNKENLVWKSEPLHDERVWNRFSFLEFIWIKIVILLRSYGISFKIINKFKMNITENISLKSSILESPYSEAIFNLIPEEVKEDYLNWLNSANQEQNETNWDINIPIFLLIVASAIINRENICLLIKSDGEFLPYQLSKHNEISKFEGFNEFFMNSYFSVSLNEILKDFISDKSKLNISGKMELLTPRESQIIEAIRNTKNPVHLKIRFEKGEPSLIEVTEENRLERENYLLGIIMKNGYQNIEITTENGKIIKSLNTKKTKVKGTE